MKSKVKHFITVSLFVAPVVIFIAVVIYNAIVIGTNANLAIM